MGKLATRATLALALVICFVAATLGSDAYAQRRGSRAQSCTGHAHGDSG